MKLIILILGLFLLFACDDTSSDRPGGNTDPSLCIAACYRVEDCFGFENFENLSLNQCLDTCSKVSESENDCFDYCEQIADCGLWLDCFLDC